MSEKKRGLGRGLGALIPSQPQQEKARPTDAFFPAATPETETSAAQKDLQAVPGAEFREISVNDIRPNPKQPRSVFDEEAMAELIASIREVGVLQPIVVRKIRRHQPGDPTYELIMGERRWRATQQAELENIPAIIKDTSDDDILRDALLENLHRANLNPLEEAASYRQLLDDFNCTHEELAERIARSRSQISNTLRLLKLPGPVQRRLAAGVISAGHARALLSLDSPEQMEHLAKRIVAEGLSVRSVEEIIASKDDVKPKRKSRPRAGTYSPLLDDVANSLSDRFDTTVKVNLGRNKGKITVEFASMQDLERILDVMGVQNTPDMNETADIDDASDSL